MSLLDQLSSLCIQSTFANSIFSFTNCQQSLKVTQDRRNFHLSSESISSKEQNNNNNKHSSKSQQKVIKLFDDDELQANWKFAKTDRKLQQSQQKPFATYISTTTSIKQPSQYISSQFNQLHTPQKDNQSLLINLTKMSYLVKNKLRKIHYEFFVKLEKYNKHLKQQQLEQQSAMKSNKLAQMQCFITKLNQAIGVIELKYFNSNSERKGDGGQLCQAFEKIKKRAYVCRKLGKLEKMQRNVIYREFFVNLHKHNKKAIKTDLFYELISSVITKKLHQNKIDFFMTIFKQSRLLKRVETKYNDIQFVNEEQNQRQQISKQKQQQQSANSPLLRSFQQLNQLTMIKISDNTPLRFNSIKGIKPKIKLQESLILFHHQQQQQKPQNLPLKLHHFKAHEQQINLNDCIDNGHLLMTQMKVNTSFIQQLESLTVSLINSKNSDTSLNSSSLVDRLDGEKDKLRKSVNTHQKVRTATLIPSNSTNQHRKSLVITKRKQSLNQFSTYENSLYNTERQKLDNNWRNKSKSTNNSANKINHKQSQVNDKEIIKKMLQQLNQKFACHDKVISITLSNRKPTQIQKKQSNANSSTKKVQRKKVHSQLVSNSCALNCIQNEKINDNIFQNQCKNSEQLQFLSQVEQNGFSECFEEFMQNKRMTQKKKPTIVQQELRPQQQRIHQSRSQIQKRNANLWYKEPDNSETCKILSKYRAKKGYRPESNLKIDLVSSENKLSLQDANKYSYCLGLLKPQHRYNQGLFMNDNKLKNSLFFRDHSEASKEDSLQNLSFGSQKLSIITPKQSNNGSNNEPYFQKKHYYNPQQLSPSKDSAIVQYLGYLPSERNLKQNSEEMISSHYTSVKTCDKKDNTSSTYSYETNSSKRLFSKPSTPNTSIEKKRSSVEKNKEEWDLMFQKQKKKFFKNQDAPKMTKKKSLLNEQVITEIKNKIDQCFILSQKDQNTISNDLTLKKAKNQSPFMKDKANYNQSIKIMSQQGSKKNSLSKLYTTLNKLRRPEPQHYSIA